MQSKILSKIEKILQKESLECYVVMLGNKSETSDEVTVEMTYDGDEALSCYMLENAQSILSSKIEQTNKELPSNESIG